jgi:hypothetical protein
MWFLLACHTPDQLGLDTLRWDKTERLQVKFKRQKNVLAESRINQYNGYIVKSDAMCMR